MKKQLGIVALSAAVALSAVVSANTGAVATTTTTTGTVASGTVMTGNVTTGTVASGAVMTGAKVKTIHDLLDGHFKKNSKKAAEKKALITTLVSTLKDAATKLGSSFEHLKADYDLVISALESYKI